MRVLDLDDPRSIGGGSGAYQVLARIGAGGMGTVYLGRSAGGRTVAIKVMHAELALDGECRDRFRREAAAARLIGGGFSPSVIDGDTEAVVPWLVTEFLPSVPLRDAVRNFGPLPVASARALAAGAAEALSAIHRAGVVHLDVNPGNVLLAPDGPRMIDFGIAQLGNAPAPGALAGTTGFMSPEQVAGAPTGTPSDVFSLGSTLVYACTGAGPFGTGSAEAVRYRIRYGSPWLSGIADEGLRATIASCLSREPSGRPTMDELIGRLGPAAPQGQLTGTSWLPAAVAAEIHRRRIEAENPPVAPRPAGRTRRLDRRALLLGGTGAGALACAAGAWILLSHRAPARSGPGAGQTPKTPASPSASPEKAHTLEFYLTGDATLTSLTYTVNGQATTVKNVKLPWRTLLNLRSRPGRNSWHLGYDFTPGTVTLRVLADGFQLATQEDFSSYPNSSKADGTTPY